MFGSASHALRTSLAKLTVAVLFFGGSFNCVAALEEKDSEKAARKACEEKLCRLILDKPSSDEALTCEISKTWGKAKIQEGATSKKIVWSFGDARCSVSLRIPHRAVVHALTKPKYTFTAAPHTVHCDVEMGNGIEPVRAVFEPKLKFEGGRVKKAWVGLKEVEGPALVKGLVWTTAQLEDTLGIFHREMVKEINKFVHKTCANDYAPDGKAKKNGGKDKKESDGKAKKNDSPNKKVDATKGGAGPNKTNDARRASETEKPGEAKKPAERDANQGGSTSGAHQPKQPAEGRNQKDADERRAPQQPDEVNSNGGAGVADGKAQN